MTRSKQFRLLQLLRPKICAIDEICDPVKWWSFQRASFWSFYLFLRLLYREGKLFLFFYRSDGSRRKCSLRFNLVQSFSSIRGSTLPSSTSSFFTYGILILPFLATLFKKSFTWITVKLEEALDIRNAVSFVGRRKQRLLWPGRVSTARHLLTANNFVEIEKGRESMDGRFYIGWWRHFKKKKTGNRASREVNVDFHQHRPANKTFVRKFYRTGPLKSPPLTSPPRRFLSADRPNLFAGQLHFPGRRIERRPPLRGRSTSETGTRHRHRYRNSHARE